MQTDQYKLIKMMKRSALGLVYFIHALRKVGVNVDERLAKIGLRLDDFDHATLIHPALESGIFEAIAADLHPEQGLWIGQQYTLIGYGPLLMLMMACQNLEEAFKKGEKYHALTHLIGRILVEKHPQYTVVYYQPEQQLKSSVALLRAQAEVAGTLKFTQDLFKMMRIPMPELLVKLPFDMPRHPDMLRQYYEYYGENVEFNSERMEFRFNDNFAEVMLPTGNIFSLKTIEQQCAQELQRLQGTSQQADIVQRVKDYLSLQHTIIPTMAETANALNLPERTLRYQLQQYDSSYKQIREQVLKTRTLNLLQSEQYSIEQIAEMLGYSEPAAFNHAFKRWFGQSPKQYLK